MREFAERVVVVKLRRSARVIFFASFGINVVSGFNERLDLILYYQQADRHQAPA